MKKILLFVFACAFAFANEIVYSDVVKSLYADKSDKKAIGRLLPTAPVEILEKDGDMLKIKIEGYIQDDVSKAIYFSEGKRILTAAFGKNAAVDVKVLEKGAWSKVSVEAYTDDKDFYKELKPIMDRAAGIYTESCSMCHALHSINEYNANQWPSILKSMLSRTVMDKKDRFLVSQYLQKTTTKE